MPKGYKVGDTTYQFPDNFTDEQATNILKSQGIIKMPEPEKPASAASRFSTGLYESTLGPIVETVKHPIDTTVGAFKQATGIGDLQEAYKRWQAGERGPAALAAFKFMTQGPGERMAEGMVQPIAQDVREGNYAGAAGRTVGTVGSFAAPELARKTPWIIPNKIGGALEGSATRQYNRVLGPTTKANKFLAKGVVEGYDAAAPELGPGARVRVPGTLERGTTALTRKSFLGKVNSTLADVNTKLEAEWGKLPTNQGPPLADVERELSTRAAAEFLHKDPVTGKMLSTGPHAEAGTKFMGTLQKYLRDSAVPDAKGNKYIPWETMRRFRQDWDELANAGGAFSGAELANKVKVAGYKASANGLREVLNKANPSISALNRELSFWKDAQKVMTDTLMRTESQSKPLGVKMARTAGQAVGFGKAGPAGAVLGGEAMDAIESAFRSTGWQTVSAVTKDRLAQAIAAGDSKLAKNIALGAVGVGAVRKTAERKTPWTVPPMP